MATQMQIPPAGAVMITDPRSVFTTNSSKLLSDQSYMSANNTSTFLKSSARSLLVRDASFLFSSSFLLFSSSLLFLTSGSWL